METKEIIENLLIECREMLANKKFPLAENELVESHVSSSFEFGYICGALRYREQPSLPSNLDDAAEEYADHADYDYAECNPYYYTVDAFKAGAEWMAGQGVKSGDLIDKEFEFAESKK